jgi:hypothetical protein
MSWEVGSMPLFRYRVPVVLGGPAEHFKGLVGGVVGPGDEVVTLEFVAPGDRVALCRLQVEVRPDDDRQVGRWQESLAAYREPYTPGPVRTPLDLTRAELEEFVGACQDRLFYDDDGEPDPDRECNGGDLVELVGGLLEGRGMRPEAPDDGA